MAEVGGFAAVQKQIAGGNQKNRLRGGNGQTADNRAGQRRVGFAAGAEFRGHRDQADQGRQRGHQDRAQSHSRPQRDGLAQSQPSARSRLMNSTIRMLSETEIPTTSSMPMSAITLIGVLVK